MYILLLDETNVESTKINNFFIYGGIFLPLEIVPVLHNKIIEIRKKAGFQPTDFLKFETHSKPPSVISAAFSQAKDELINACIDNKVLFITYIVHHNIAKKHTLEKKIQWASNEIIAQFDLFLQIQHDKGFVIFDSLPFKGSFRYIANLFNVGITTATSNTPHIPINIVSYSMSTTGASHLVSATDIILGAFRYCVNVSEESVQAKKMFPNILKLMYGNVDKEGEKNVIDYGLLIRPHRNVAYQKEYGELVSKLNSFLQK